MKTILTKAGLSVAMAATALTVAAPADAQRYRRYDRGGGDVATGAIIGGIVGLGLGAAIASSNRRDRYYDNRAYYDDGYRYDRRQLRRERRYLRNRGYAQPRGYYAPRGYYGQNYAPGYYAPGYGYNGY